MEKKLKPGEKGFSIIILLLGIGFLFESIKMFIKDPTSASFGALPLFLSVLIVICMLKVIIFEDRNRETEGSAMNITEKIKNVLNYVLRKDIFFMFLLIMAYCLALFYKLGFQISTGIFLFVSMTYLIGKDYLKNFVYTLVSLGFILVIFKTVFQVILP